MPATALRAALGAREPRTPEAWLDDAGNLVIPAAALAQGREESASIMLARARPPESGSASVARRALVAVAFATLLLIALVAVFAVNGERWQWTGFAHNTSLWTWLHLLQPVALAILAVRLLIGAPVRVRRAASVISVAALALLVAGGYGAHWSWTGFPGKPLWDWLRLTLFPVVIILLPEWVRRGEPFGRRARIIAALVAGAFALLVVGGYRWGWTWTGFTGNTFRDWLDLMIAPFLLPAAFKVVHALHVMRAAASRRPGAQDLVVQISISR